MFKEIPVVIVAAMSAKRRVIGRDNDLLWDLPADLKHFRTLTTGHPVVMGRKTFESILAISGRPLPKRPNIVVTRNADYSHEADRVEVVTSLEAGLETATKHNPTEIHIGGGSQLYEQALPYVDRLHLTYVHDEPEGDAFFPDIPADFQEVERSSIQEHEGIQYEWVDLKR